jgi:hypothetical protein
MSSSGGKRQTGAKSGGPAQYDEDKGRDCRQGHEDALDRGKYVAGPDAAKEIALKLEADAPFLKTLGGGGNGGEAGEAN